MEHQEGARNPTLAFERVDGMHRPKHAPPLPDPRAGGADFKLSVVMAAHNEVHTIGEAISGVLAHETPFDLELIVVDDGSDDGTTEVIASFEDPRLVRLRHGIRRGKGAALVNAAAVATGSHLLIFDADLEYSPDDIPALVEPVVKGIAEVVYGSRVPGMRTAFHSFRYTFGSRFTTVVANVLFDAWLTDMHTCLKLLPVRLFREVAPDQRGFGLDTEITAEMLRRGIRPYEVPCSYRGRTVASGKKISARDGFECLRLLVHVRLRGLVAYDLEALERPRVLHGTGEAGRAGARAAHDGFLVVDEEEDDRGGAPAAVQPRVAALSSGGVHTRAP